MARRPAVGVAVSVMAGIVLHRRVPVCPAAWLLLAGIVAGVAIVFRHRRQLFSVLIAAGLVAALCAGAQLHAFYFSRDHIAHYTRDTPRLARVRATLVTPARVEPPPPTAPRPQPPRQVFLAEVTAIQAHEGWQTATGRVRVWMDGDEPALSVGQPVEMLGLLSRPLPPMNPGQFDFASYSRYRQVLATLRVESGGNVRALAAGRLSPLWWLRQAVRDKLQQGFTDAQALDRALLEALLLGDRNPLLREVQDRFIQTGTSHHLAISGMHVAVLGAFVYGLCRLLRLRPRRSAWIGLGFVALYGLVTVPSPPVVRSILLCLAFGLGVIMRRSTDAVQLLALTVIGMLLYSPLDLYQPGFQLSFGCVLGLILLTPPIRRLWTRPRTATAFNPLIGNTTPSILRQLSAFMLRGLGEALAAGIAAWLVSMPLVAWHFDRLNPWSILASLLLGVPVFLGLVGGLLKVVLTLMLPGAAGTWALAAQGPMIAMRHLAAWLASVPASDLPFPALPGVAVGVYYTVLLAMQIPSERWRAWTRWTPALVGAMALGLGLLPRCRPTGAPVRLTVLSVGAGSCAVAELDGGRVLVFDAGSSTLADPYRSVIGPFLRTRGIRHIETIYLSHADADHYNAVIDLLAQCTVEQVAVGDGFERACRAHVAGRMLLDEIQRRGVPLVHLARGQVIAHGAARVQVLWPGTTAGLDANDASLVLKLSCNGRSVLFTGDIQAAAERQLLVDPPALRSTVLVAPHHGSAEPTTAAFIGAAGAQWVLSSNDRTLTGKQKALEACVPPGRLWRTHQCGAIHVTIAENGAMDVAAFVRRN